MSAAPLLLLAVLAQSPGPLARTRLEPAETVTVGQPISVVVEVLVPSYFMGAPRFPDLEVPDALVVFEPRGTNFTERVYRVTFAGQSRRYNIYPQRPGTFEIPEIPVEVRYFSDGPTDAVVSPDPVRFGAIVPSGAEGLDPFIASTRLTLEEVYEPKPVEIRVGDAFVRTLTVTVESALSMVLPPLAFESAPGLAVYPAPPLVTDSGGERGSAIVGRRVESATYVAESTGVYELPEIVIGWWDVSSSRRMRASAPALELTVIASEAGPSEIALPPEEEVVDETEEGGARVSLLSRLQRFGPVIALAVLLLWCVIRAERWLAPRLARARDEHRISERAYFARFRNAALSNDPRATARTFMAWLDRRNESRRTAQFHDFAEAAQDPALEREARALGAVLYGDGSEEAWSGGRLYSRVAKARTQHERERDGGSSLPPLNPLSEGEIS